jgi:thioredoxin reductase (NADPH)
VNHASQVTILLRGDSLEAKMSQYLVDRIYEHPRIDVKINTQIGAIHGTDSVESITLRNTSAQTEETFDASALFIFIGAVPRTDWLKGVVQCDSRGFIPTGPDLMPDGKQPLGWPLVRDPFLLESSVPGIFAVGDVRANSIKRVASAVGEGSIAVRFVHQHLSNL